MSRAANTSSVRACKTTAPLRSRLCLVDRNPQSRLGCANKSAAIALMLLIAFAGISSSLMAQEMFVLEDFEFAVSDQAARNGVVDLTDFANTPANYINGDGEGASTNEPGGLYSIGTDAAFCVQFCAPGSFVGFRRYFSPQQHPSICPNSSRRFATLQFTYGDPNHPGPVQPDFPLSDLTMLCDVYGDGAFCDGLEWTHYWVNLVDCEGEVFEFVTLGEFSLCSTAWTFNMPVGRSFARLSPDSLTEVPNGDRLLTEIAAIEVLIQDVNDPPVALGKWYVDYLRVGEPAAPAINGDFDDDGDVDLIDYSAIRNCLLGPAVIAPQSCLSMDLTNNARVDLRDVSVFQIAFGQ